MSGHSEEKLNVDIIVEFLEVAIHCILYNRNLYPQGVFEKKIKYNVPVQMCLHPDVCAYVGHIIQSLKLLLAEGKVEKVAVVILQEDTGLPVEKFVFEVSDLKEKWRETDPHLFRVEQALRGFLLKLNVSDGLLMTSSTATTWTIHAHTKDSTLSSAEEKLIQMDFPWTEADEQQQKIPNAKIIPVKSVSTDIFDMQLYVEEGGDPLS
ncbi:mitotic spindle assembly checkpoint protein MAD2B [Aplysia californica]|uniref:Mitotic spindle assembly checkpoint protein MAD2B n=1 Tax=Aplysia californica TaxID=6500 RepID=A0ABM0K4A5_APLCA|nr:mitotic spindle assembly checkpoint protein MAD2B [Aplysia californica]